MVLGIVFSVFFVPLVFPQQNPLSISSPSTLFNLPSMDVLRSAEICLSGGSSFGMESRSALVRNFTVGLGGIAEAEISTSGMTNQLTGESESFATSSFKVNLVPDRLRRFWFVPNVVVQLKSSSWKSIENEPGSILPVYTHASAYSGENLMSLRVKQRFSDFRLIFGKRWTFGGVLAGVCATDVRLKEGIRDYYTVEASGQTLYRTGGIPEMQEHYWTPLGGIEIQANDKTRLMAEIQSVPVFDFDVGHQNVVLSKAWLGVAGIRFFITDWFTLDAGVKTQSNDKGIADAEIRLGGNWVIPVPDWIKKAASRSAKRVDKKTSE
jgi:hypothetical protein